MYGEITVSPFANHRKHMKRQLKVTKKLSFYLKGSLGNPFQARKPFRNIQEWYKAEFHLEFRLTLPMFSICWGNIIAAALKVWSKCFWKLLERTFFIEFPISELEAIVLRLHCCLQSMNLSMNVFQPALLTQNLNKSLSFLELKAKNAWAFNTCPMMLSAKLLRQIIHQIPPTKCFVVTLLSRNLCDKIQRLRYFWVTLDHQNWVKYEA